MGNLKSTKTRNAKGPPEPSDPVGLLVRQRGTERPYAGPVRDLDAIDRELRLLALLRAKTKESGGRPSTRVIDQLLDERQELTSRQPASNI